MSFVALVTDRFDEMAAFYGLTMGFAEVKRWERSNGRGIRFDLGSLVLELVDNQRKSSPLKLRGATNRVHLVVELDDINDVRQKIPLATGEPTTTAWGAKLLEFTDPDGTTLTLLQWTANDQSTYCTRRGSNS